MPANDFINLIESIGVTGLLIFIFWGTFIKTKPLWYSTHEYDQIYQEMREWKAMALRATGMTGDAIAKSAQAVDLARAADAARQAEIAQQLAALQKEMDRYVAQSTTRGE